MDGMTRFPKRPAASPRLGGSPFIASTTGYPWADGDILYAADLNAAVAGGGVSVLELGAAGDGITDDTAAIQAALNGYAGKGVVFIPDTGHPYMVNSLTIPSGTDLLLHGTLRLVAGGGTMMYVYNVNNVTIRGHGTLDGNGASAAFPSACIASQNATNIQISGVTLKNAKSWNLNIVSSSHVRVDSVSMLAGHNSNQFAQGCDDCWLTNSLVDGPDGDGGFCFYGGVTNSGAIGNLIRNAGLATNANMRGLYILSDSSSTAACSGIILSNNVIHHCSGSGLYCDSASGNQHQDIVIANNQCHDNGRSGLGPEADIGVSSTNNVLIAGNQSLRFGNSATAQYGIFTGACTGVSVVNNVVGDAGVGGTAGVGLQVANTNSMSASGNHFYGLGSSMVTAIGGTAGLQNAFMGNLCDMPNTISLQPDSLASNFIQGSWTVLGQNYSFSRDKTTHFWNFIDGANTNLTIRTDGEIIARTNIVTTGGVVQGQAFYSGANQVVGSRISGWGVSTGGVRAPITAGSTLPQIAAALSQLLTDLTTHGMIGQ